MKTLDIWLPTYKRPHKLAEVAQNIKETTFHPYTLYFGVEPFDLPSIEAARAIKGAVSVQNRYEQGYSNAIQSMYEVSKNPFWFHANDDFYFYKNWDLIPISMFETESVKVIGVKQTADDTDCSAVFFGRRSYIEKESGVINMPNRVFYPYKHNYQDTEFTRTARKRGVWAKCDAPCINHLHPGFTGADKDETYRMNDATVEQDRITFESRQHLWN